MSHLFVRAMYLSLTFQLLFVSLSSENPCSQSLSFASTSASNCANDYNDLITVATENSGGSSMNDYRFIQYLINDLTTIATQTTWYDFWNAQQQTIDQDSTDILHHCQAIQPIQKSDLHNTCLCQLQDVCIALCDEEIGLSFWQTATESLHRNDDGTYSVLKGGTGAPLASQQQCQTVISDVQDWKSLCQDTNIYNTVNDCAENGNGTPPPTQPTTSTTASPTNKQSTPSPTTTTTTSSPVTLSTVVTIPDTYTTPSDLTPETTVSEPSERPSLSPLFDINATVYEPTARPTDMNASIYANQSEEYQPDTYGGLGGDFKDTETPSTTAEFITEVSHPFANLLLVSLIILGFCVFVAWYAKKNQISADGMNTRDEDNGYLWGLNKSSSPSDERMNGLVKDSNRAGKFGKFKHKKLSQFDDDEQLMNKQMTLQMTQNTMHNNDLLAITPDHIGRLQTQPHSMAPKIPKQKHKKRMRRVNGSKFAQLQENNISDESSSSSGEDMMKMRDSYYAAQTFSKKLAGAIGDISDTVKETAEAVKSKLIKREAAVVVPMQVRPAQTNERQERDNKKKKYPFTIVEDNETTDGFDMSGNEQDSASTQENEYRDDSETEMRVNVHGKKIKQPMGLPTFDDEEEDDINILAQSHEKVSVSVSVSSKKEKKRKRKDKKRKRKRDKDRQRKKEVIKEEVKASVHDINIRINNEDNMGFGTDELNEENNIELTKEDVTMTMNDLQRELMKAGLKNESNGNVPAQISMNGNAKEDLFKGLMDDIEKSNSNGVDVVVNGGVKSDDLANGNGIVGNGTNENVIEQD